MTSANFKAVLFDLDGTLLDTIEDITDLMNDVLGRFGFPPHGPDDYKRYVGDGRLTLVLRALPEDRRDDATAGEVLRLAGVEFTTRRANKARAYEGIPELLTELTNHGMKMSILSNRPDDSTRALVEALLGRWSFDAVIGARNGIPLKPDPTVAIEISKSIGIAPEKFIYAGDSNVDMMTAIAAGMYPVGVLWGFRPAEELIESGAKTLVERPEQMLSLL